MASCLQIVLFALAVTKAHSTNSSTYYWLIRSGSSSSGVQATSLECKAAEEKTSFDIKNTIVSCCADSGGDASLPDCEVGKTLSESEAICVANGKRLCTEAEIRTDAVTRAGKRALILPTTSQHPITINAPHTEPIPVLLLPQVAGASTTNSTRGPQPHASRVPLGRCAPTEGAPRRTITTSHPARKEVFAQPGASPRPFARRERTIQTRVRRALMRVLNATRGRYACLQGVRKKRSALSDHGVLLGARWWVRSP